MFSRGLGFMNNPGQDKKICRHILSALKLIPFLELLINKLLHPGELLALA